MGNCPVCQKVFHADDIKHVLDLVGSCSVPLVDIHDKEVLDDKKILLTDTEISRRSKFETILQLQKERGGLFEPQTDGVLFASMRLSESFPDLPLRLTLIPAYQVTKGSQKPLGQVILQINREEI